MKFSQSNELVILSLALLCSLPSVFGFGARAGQCNDDPTTMATGMSGKNDPALGWTITVDSTSYEPGKPIKVTLKPKTDGEAFKGLLLFARATNNAHLGTWETPAGFQTLDEQCKLFGRAKSTLSHADGTEKDGPLTLTWNPPKRALGNLEFRGLLVTKDKTTWMALAPVVVTGAGSIENATLTPNNGNGNGNSSGSSESESSAVPIGLNYVGTIIASWLALTVLRNAL